jgi:dTDP-4-dehydrorhamnose reductase
MSAPRVLVIGAGGMLGHKLCQVLGGRFETWATARNERPVHRSVGLANKGRLLTGVEVTSFETVVSACHTVQPDVIINAVGIVKQLDAAKDPVASVEVNALFPHRLSRLCREGGIRLVHISTDCVFSGRGGMYTEEDLPDPIDTYGTTKLTGEVLDGEALTIRTSIIGRELDTNHGLVEWFLSNTGGSVKGFTRAVFSGFPTLVLADIIGDIIESHADLSGVYHVAAEPIDKYGLLCLLREAYNVHVEIEPDDAVHVDRSLDGTTFRETTGFAPASWPDLVKVMADDSTPYEELRR